MRRIARRREARQRRRAVDAARNAVREGKIRAGWPVVVAGTEEDARFVLAVLEFWGAKEQPEVLITDRVPPGYRTLIPSADNPEGSR